MEVYTLCLRPMEQNCYLIVSSQNRALVIDPGSCPHKILTFCEEKQLQVAAIVLTHGHFDHIGAVSALAERYHAPVCISEADAPMLEDGEKSLASLFGLPHTPAKADRLLHEGDSIVLNELSFTVLETPGHTKGSICLLGHGLLITGDTLFRDSIGRTDFPGGSMTTLSKSLQRICSLDRSLRVLAGHNAETTIDREIRRNPYLTAL